MATTCRAGGESCRDTAHTINECRSGCGACCIAPSITSPIPGMPDGKPAGIRCVQLTDDERCLLFEHPERPAVCASLRPHPEMCGASREEAMRILVSLEIATQPGLTASAEPSGRSREA